jgi:hypothetical protein
MSVLFVGGALPPHLVSVAPASIIILSLRDMRSLTISCRRSSRRARRCGTRCWALLPPFWLAAALGPTRWRPRRGQALAAAR